MFDIGAVIGILEYFDLDTIAHILNELNRVLGHGGRLALDMPNRKHPLYQTMVLFEAYQGRTKTTIRQDPRCRIPSDGRPFRINSRIPSGKRLIHP